MSGRQSGPISAARRPTAASEWLSLAAAWLPVVVAVIRAIIKDWTPVGDATYFTVRSADVLTEHHPLVGAWSSGSLVVGVPVNNLGPLQLDVLAPFTKLTPYVGTAIGSALISTASIVIVWTVARRMFRPAVVVGVMAGTTLFVAALGLSWLIDARQQQAMVLPLYALLWLSAAMWLGVGFAVPIAVVVASLVVQTHFTFGYPAALVFVGGLAGFIAVTWRTRDGWTPVAIWSLVLGALCWLQPLVDQFAGTGNLGTVLGPARDRPGAGLEVGVQIMAGAALVPPFWSPDSMRTFLLPYDGISLPGAVVAVLAWLIGAAIVILLGFRARAPRTWAMGIASAIAIVAGARGRGADPGVVVRPGATELLLGVVARRLRHHRPRRRCLLAARRRLGVASRVLGPEAGCARDRHARRRRSCGVAAVPGRIGRIRRGRGSTCWRAAARPTRRRHRLRRRRRSCRSRPLAGVLRQRLPVRDARRAAAGGDRVPLRSGQPQSESLRRVPLRRGRTLRTCAAHLRPAASAGARVDSCRRGRRRSATPTWPSTPSFRNGSATSCAMAPSTSTAPPSTPSPRDRRRSCGRS